MTASRPDRFALCEIPRYPLNGSLGGPHSRSERIKNLLLLPGRRSNHDTPAVQMVQTVAQSLHKIIFPEFSKNKLPNLQLPFVYFQKNFRWVL